MSDRPRPSGEPSPPSLGERQDKACDRFEAAWRAGQRPPIEPYLGEVPEPERPLLFRELLGLELDYRRRKGEMPTPEEYRQWFPAYATVVDDVFGEVLGSAAAKASRESVSTGPEAATGGGDGHPACLGRYRITATLGQGNFGIVYQGYDQELHRPVAVKVPHRHRISQPKDIAAYLAEARVLARLDHSHIVPVYDCGHTADGLCFVVSKFIAGSDLRQRIQAARLSFIPSAELVATIAEALHYAHVQGLVHRDVKPGNILLDAAGKPYVADFGLVLKEEDFGKGASFAGTPAYMSPEQARSEGHRVDGRSDIFSLGVVFYELLTGRRPFRGETRAELLEQIIAVEARPPRQIDDAIPKELERICLKALAKRATERYTTAKDFADDLRHFLARALEPERSTAAGQGGIGAAAGPAPVPGPVPPPASDHRSVRVVPKGLRSFDAHDADFFLELLPGPRDRDGLPESLRFWKTRIEETDPDQTFAVGLLYGPSGCGKSSLVKAGLLPRLAPHVLCVYVEATAGETETRLLKGLQKLCPDFADDLSLVEALAALRRGQGIPAGKKVLVVLDQFEQWLHAKRQEESPELVHALRQCDGGRVQTVLMVRDDFWLAISRFVKNVEIELVQGRNVALVDLFGTLHAQKVLAAFGRAFGALPEGIEELTEDQDAFLDQAIAGLAQDSRVIPIRLALFGEMVKDRPWTPATLKEFGGTEGVGVAFLEGTFSSASAPPQHRLHQRAARSVLRGLLPEQGVDLKGNMRSHEELLRASGYASRPWDFEELLRILDFELRLITPADPEASNTEYPALEIPARDRYYQLTHDYLVPPLRDWLTRKQRETWRGRAELRLAELTALWYPTQESRYLPTFAEWVSILLLTKPRHRTGPQICLMRSCRSFYALRVISTLGLIVLLIWVLGHGKFVNYLCFLSPLSVILFIIKFLLNARYQEGYQNGYQAAWTEGVGGIQGVQDKLRALEESLKDPQGEVVPTSGHDG